MKKTLLKKILKLLFLTNLSLLLSFNAFFNLSFVTKAQEINTLSECSNTTCLTNISDTKISNDGSFYVTADSQINSYLRVVNFLQEGNFNSKIIDLKDENPNNAPLKVEISQDNKKIIAFREEKEKKKNTIEKTIYLQETSCKCGANEFFDGTRCISGTLSCSNTQDQVCGCDSLNYLNSCIARANGVKSFTKAACGTSPTLTCIRDDQCPIGSCPLGESFQKFNCPGGMCALITYSIDPCPLTTSSSGATTDCKCTSGNVFANNDCIKGTLDCSTTAIDQICGCDNKNYSNSCFARATGIKKFTKGQCGSDQNLSCSLDDECPIGICPNGNTFKKFTCTSKACTNIVFSSEPCSLDCKCTSGNFFDEKDCIKGTLDCSNKPIDQVCGCDNKNYLNSCIARVNGIKIFTKGQCGSDQNLSCSSDDQCPIGICTGGDKFKKFTCKNGKCTQIAFSSEPCLLATVKSETIPTLIHIIDQENDSVKTFNPTLENDDLTLTELSFSTLSFLDAEGKKIIASDNKENDPNLNIIDVETTKVEKQISIPESAQSIEFSPDFTKAVITFKEKFSHSIGIYIKKSNEVTKIDIPSNIFFKIDEFLSGVSFDLFSKKATVSSLGGSHVFHLVDLKDNRLTVLFLSKDIEGKTLSTISPDGASAVSASNIFDKDGIVVYKINTKNPRKPRITNQEKFIDKSKVLDVKITPDNNNILILLKKDSETKIKVLSLQDLSLVCEYNVSTEGEENQLILDPLGRYIVIPDLKNNIIEVITKLQTGPVFKSISPGRGKTKGGGEFTINGFIDLIKLNSEVKVCFRNKNFCANSVKVSSDGKIISGTIPRFTSPTKEDLIIIANEKENIAGSSQGNTCPAKPNTESRYIDAFKFE